MSLGDALRRALLRRERGLLRAYLLALLLLNLLPLAWLAGSRWFGIEGALESWAWERWPRRLAEVEQAAAESEPAAAARRYRELLETMPELDLRETGGRTRQDLRARLAESLLAAGRPGEAATVARALRTTDPKDARGHELLGEALWAQEERDPAVEAFRAALAIQPQRLLSTKRVMAWQLARGELSALLDLHERYQRALWVGEGAINLRAGETFRPETRLTFPVLVDGRPHRYRLLPGGGELRNGWMRLRPPARLRAIALRPIDLPGVRVELKRLRIEPARHPWDPPGAPLWESEDFTSWGEYAWHAEGFADARESGLLRTGSAGGLLWKAASLPDPATWGAVTLEMTCSKARDAELLSLVQEARQGLGRLPAPPPSRYAFAVLGHVRGGPQDLQPVHPELLPALPRLAREHAFAVLTGDTVWLGTEERWASFRAQVAQPLGLPLHLVLGNHDLGPGRRRALFERAHGPGYRAWRHQGSLHLIADGEASPGDLDAAQTAWLGARLAEAAVDPEVRHVFLYVHRVLWFFGTDRYAALTARANRSSRADPAALPTRFWRELFPRLRELARTRRVILFAGDVGSTLPWVHDRLDGVELIASGLSGHESTQAAWNHCLQVEVAGDAVQVKVRSLTGRALPPLERLNLEFWKAHPETPTPEAVVR